MRARAQPSCRNSRKVTQFVAHFHICSQVTLSVINHIQADARDSRSRLFADRFACNLKSKDPRVCFAIRGETLSATYALLASMPERGRNPLGAQITGEDEIHNQVRGWSFAANLACQWNASCIGPSQFVPGPGHLQFPRPQPASSPIR